MPRFLIVGAGPTGIGAALHLLERGERDLLVLDSAPRAGGLAGSVTDPQGFTWDRGGHVQFSHYRVFDDWMDRALGQQGWLHHERESWVWMRGRFVPYPFQYNLHRLPPDERWDCVRGLFEVQGETARPANFREWILATFGEGVARSFLLPYNFKVWAHPLEMMNTAWVGERVAVPDIRKVVQGICLDRDEVSWGPNNRFRFPKHGGTGAIWEALARLLPAGTLALSEGLATLEAAARRATTTAGRTLAYDELISTIPLDDLCRRVGDAELVAQSSQLLYSGTHVVGIGLAGAPPEHLRTKCWMYFPEDDTPCYRVTVFSNYSPNNAVRPGETWSLMGEVAQSPYKPVDHGRIVEDVVAGFRATRLISEDDVILSRYAEFLPRGYPTPSLSRDGILARVLPALDRLGIHSRGRFGAWKYEVSNQDHSFMQGWECAGRLLDGSGPEAERTLHDPNGTNARYNR